MENEKICYEQHINYDFKVLYALAIILIVAGHSAGGGINLFFDWFPNANVGMAIFIFSSGYFYKKKDESNLPKAVLHKIRTLVIPMYLYNAFYAVVATLLRKLGFKFGLEITLHNLFIEPWISGHQFIYNLAGWFLAPLFVIYVFNLCFRKIAGVNVNEKVYQSLSNLFTILLVK